MRIENEYLRLEFLPEIGGKMIRLEDTSSGCQFLLPSQSNQGRYRIPAYGGSFEDYDTSGFDDCFPTIEPSPYRSLSDKNRKYSIELPDHGEVWSRSWECSVKREGIRFSIRGICVPYEFQKFVTLEDRKVHFHYTLKNSWHEPLSYLWSAHPLLNVEEGAALLIPKSVEQVFVNWASDANIGSYGSTVPWPNVLGSREERDYSKVQRRDLGQAIKCYAGPLDEGFAGLYSRKYDRSLVFEFDVKSVPYLGIWLCYSGWPLTATQKQFTVALEPCNGRPDALSKAVERGECAELRPGDTEEWHLTMAIGEGMPCERSRGSSSTVSFTAH